MSDKYDGLFRKVDRQLFEMEKRSDAKISEHMSDNKQEMIDMAKRMDYRLDTYQDAVHNEQDIRLIAKDEATSLFDAFSSKHQFNVSSLRDTELHLQNLREEVDRNFKTASDENKKLRDLMEMEKSASRNRTPEVQPPTTVDQPFSQPPPHPDMARFCEQFDKKLFDLDVRILECEQYSRRESIIISGIPNHVKHHDLQNVTIDILKELGIFVKDTDISAIHRLGRVTQSNRYPVKVIVRFVNRKIVDLCHEKKSNLPKLKRTKRMDLRFFESLAPLNQEALRISKNLYDQGVIHNYYTRNGYVKIVENEHDDPVRMSHPSIIRSKFNVSNSVT